MHTDFPLPKRRSLRIPGYDYTTPGAYFITVCVDSSVLPLSLVEHDTLLLTWAGEIVARCWTANGEHFPLAEPGEYVVMPDHFHALLYIVRARHAVPVQERMETFGRPVPGSVPTIVRSFKSAVTREINRRRGTSDASVWKRNYYEHVVRGEAELQRIREYILNNPAKLTLIRSGPA